MLPGRPVLGLIRDFECIASASNQGLNEPFHTNSHIKVFAIRKDKSAR